MDGIHLAELVSFIISLVPIPLVFLLILPHILPSSASGIRPRERFSPFTLSLCISTIFLSGQAALAFVTSHTHGSKTAGTTICAVGSALKTFLTTAVIAHQPLIAHSIHSSLPTPVKPIARPHSAGHILVLISLVYLYSLVPLIPTLTTAAHLGFRLNEGFGKWWGVYCVDRANWWRIVRPVTLIPPPSIAILFCIMIASTLYSNIGQPCASIRPRPFQWCQVAYIVTCCLGTIAYLVVEQMIGWDANWWPRAFESSVGMWVFLPLAIERATWRPYGYWIRLKRYPCFSSASWSSELDLPLSALKTPFSDSEGGHGEMDSQRDTYRTIASFFAPAKSLEGSGELDNAGHSGSFNHSGQSGRPDNSSVEGNSGSVGSLGVFIPPDSPLCAVSGRSPRPPVSTEHLSDNKLERNTPPSPTSPPFVYSVGQTFLTANTTSTHSDTLPSDPSPTYIVLPHHTATLSPTQTTLSPTDTKYNHARDASSDVSRYSNDTSRISIKSASGVSGVTSVLTEHNGSNNNSEEAIFAGDGTFISTSVPTTHQTSEESRSPMPATPGTFGRIALEILRDRKVNRI